MKKKYIFDIKKYCNFCGGDLHEGAFICEHCFKVLPKNRKTPKKRKDKTSYGNVKDFYIFRRDGFRCVYCGKTSIEDKVLLTLDHIKPKSMGGTHTVDNLVTCCKECNSIKKDLIDEKLIERIKSSIIERNVDFFGVV